MNVLTTTDLQKVLKIGEKQAKLLMRTEGFPSVQIGNQYRVEEEALNEWLRSTKSVKFDYHKNQGV